MDVRVASTISLMRELLADPISVKILSTRVNLTPERLRQIFKQETGQSPMKYLKRLRMQHAEHLLQSTFLSIKEVAFLSGMTDVSHFVRSFKREYGSTPSHFRSQLGQTRR